MAYQRFARTDSSSASDRADSSNMSHVDNEYLKDRATVIRNSNWRSGPLVPSRDQNISVEGYGASSVGQSRTTASYSSEDATLTRTSSRISDLINSIHSRKALSDDESREVCDAYTAWFFRKLKDYECDDPKVKIAKYIRFAKSGTRIPVVDSKKFFNTHLSPAVFKSQYINAGNLGAADTDKNGMASLSRTSTTTSDGAHPSGPLAAPFNPSSTARGRHNNGEFQASRKLTGIPRSVTPQRRLQAQQAGFNLDDNYQGDVTDFTLWSSRTPPHVNCAVRIEDLSMKTSLKEFFDEIYEGKVFQFSWTEPDPPKHPGRSARLVFATRLAAEQFIDRGGYYNQSHGAGIYFHGRRIKVKWNTALAPPMNPAMHYQSRILRIIGPEDRVSAKQIIKILDEKIWFDLVGSLNYGEHRGQRCVELAFASILGQARQARNYLKQKWALDREDHLFSVHYVPDPCEQN